MQKWKKYLLLSGFSVVIIVFDLTDKFTLEHAEVWHAEAVKEMKEAAFLFLVGTKKDICVSRGHLPASPFPNPWGSS